ncbi:MAG: TIGR02186 family protein [Albidovulum sp.]|nr:TIGR02186 family protein [Albidovulum sp.]
MILRALPLILALGATHANANESVVAALSQNRVSISANFDGSEILVYGAVKRDVPLLGASALHVVITVAGPLAPVVVRRKLRKFGIWINADSVKIGQAPTFHAIATTGDLEKTLSEAEDLVHEISVDQMIDAVGNPANSQDSEIFREALIRLRTSEGLYSDIPVRVEFVEETLFGTRIALPANLVEGDYSVKIYLTRDGEVIDNHEQTIFVRKVGLERWMYNLAHDQPLAYGLLSLLIAIAAGWTASAVFRFIIKA